MNHDYLGDALDHWKGSLIAILCRSRLIDCLAVVPMATDAMEWNQDDWRTYARLLNVEGDDICQRDVPFVNGADRRQQYFANLPEGQDLFLDPDTGIAINGNGGHIRVQELAQLLNGPKNIGRVLMVYQHAARDKVPRLRFVEIGGKLKRGIEECHVLVYECSQAAMFFISRNKRRIQAIENALREYLRGTAERRVWDP